jgi:16S rRNA (cytidine1402-2'-O)-methyltransferase
MLYVVATPIGNLGDLTLRARETLAQVDVIAAEDTRHTGRLLQSLGIAKPLVSMHEHNEEQRAHELIARMNRGENVALVSDAGTPLISDPGFNLVSRARAAGLRVVPIPGACAAIAALSIAGLPTDRFVFEGFLPAKDSARRARLEAVRFEARTLVFYEAPHRARETLGDIAAVLGDGRRCVVARELTKMFESTYAGTVAEIRLRMRDDADASRGEIVIVIEGAAGSIAAEFSARAEPVLRALLEELPPAQAAKLAAKLTGLKRNELYDLALRLGERK